MAIADRRDGDSPSAPSIRAALDCGRPGCACSRGPNTHCPGPGHAQGDRHPSLTVHERDGKALVNCKGGCDQAAVIAELQSMGLWPRPVADVVRFSAGRAERTVGRAAAKLVATTVDQIRDLDGVVQAEHVRQDFEDGEKNTYWRLPGGKTGLGGGKVGALPLFGMELLPGLPDGATVVLHEGEKAAKAGRDLGLLSLGTVTGAATQPDDGVLRHLVRFDIVLWPDHDAPGHKHMAAMSDRITAMGGRVRVIAWGEQPKDDAADFLERGGSHEQAVALVGEAQRIDPDGDRLKALPIVNAAQLSAMQFREPKVIVPQLLVEGATILVSPGKSGKSRLMMGIAVAVAHGGAALGSIPVEGGDVLYLALEDGMRRGQSRMMEACGGGKAPSRLDLAFTWQTMDRGGVDDLEPWLRSHPNARLVIIDTLKRFRAATDGRRNAYDVDYEALAPLNDLALKYGVCIVIVHHTNKIKLSEDPTDRASGSTGMLAAVDGMIVMERTRGKADAVLHVFHRDLEDGKYAMKADQQVGWHFLGEADEFTRTETQDEIVDAILAAGRPLKPSDVANQSGVDRKTVGQRMWQLTRPNARGLTVLVSRSGYYWPSSRPWPTAESDNDEAPYTPTGPNQEEEREGGVVRSPVLPWGGAAVADSELSVTSVSGGERSGDVVSVTGVTGSDLSGYSGYPVMPPRAPAREGLTKTWRCMECRAFERLTLPDGSERCRGCGHIEPTS